MAMGWVKRTWTLVPPVKSTLRFALPMETMIKPKRPSATSTKESMKALFRKAMKSIVVFLVISLNFIRCSDSSVYIWQ